MPVTTSAGHGDRHRGGLNVVREFAQPDKVIGTKAVVEAFEFAPKAFYRGADRRGAVFRIFDKAGPGLWCIPALNQVVCHVSFSLQQMSPAPLCLSAHARAHGV